MNVLGAILLVVCGDELRLLFSASCNSALIFQAGLAAGLAPGMILVLGGSIAPLADLGTGTGVVALAGVLGFLNCAPGVILLEDPVVLAV